MIYAILFGLFVIFQLLYVLVPLVKEKPRTLEEVERQEQRGLSVLVPAYNEELVIEKCVKSLVGIAYKNHEIIIINDGSTDATLKVLGDLLELTQIEKTEKNQLEYNPAKAFYQSQKYPNIYVIDKYNGGKADSLNAGIDYSSKEIVITLDADSVLEKDALKYINYGFKEEKTIAVGGIVHIIQGFNKEGDTYKPKLRGVSPLIKHQIIQYLCGFTLNKYTHSYFNAITVIAGAFGAFRKEVLFSVDGFRKTVGEDMDITLKFQKYIKQNNKNEKMIFMPEAICYTQCPEDFTNLFNQRFRWQRAFIDCVIHYWDDLFNNFSFLTSLYMLFDSFVLGTLVAFTVVLIPILCIFSPAEGLITLALLCMTSFVTGMGQSITVLIVLRRLGYRYSFVDYLRYLMFALYECVSYRYLGIIYATLGSISYFINTNGWKKIQRV